MKKELLVSSCHSTKHKCEFSISRNEIAVSTEFLRFRDTHTHPQKSQTSEQENDIN